MRTRYFYGWNVVGATFVMAMVSFGLGFYGLAVYVATLQRLQAGRPPPSRRPSPCTTSPALC
jgi:hypothetical protein